MSEAFELHEVVKRYSRSVHALRGVSLVGARGEILGLLGPNGAGKTTAVKCLTGLVRPTSGRALIDGVEADRRQARALLGYMPERPRYTPELSANELLDREGRIYGLARGARRDRIAELSERVGLEPDVAARRVRTYSKGEQARLGIGLALMGNPQVVLLDEPTDGLDPLGRRAVRDLLLSLREEHRAVLLNSHLLSEVEACCDRVVILKQGEVLATGTTADLLGGRRVVYQVRLAAAPPPGLLEALGPLTQTVSAEASQLSVTLQAAPEIDAVLDAIRDAGGRVRELRPQASLEDVFVELVTGGPSASDGPTVEPAAEESP